MDVYNFILPQKKFLQFDWLRAVVLQINLKYLHVKITNLLRVVVARFVRHIWHKSHSWYFKIVSNFTRLTARKITYNNFETSLVVFMTKMLLPIQIVLYLQRKIESFSNCQPPYSYSKKKCSKYNIHKFIMLFLQQGKLHARKKRLFLVSAKIKMRGGIKVYSFKSV